VERRLCCDKNEFERDILCSAQLLDADPPARRKTMPIRRALKYSHIDRKPKQDTSLRMSTTEQ